MSAFVDSLNLRPQEKRVIVVIGVVVFVALNFVFVFPQFKEKARIAAHLKITRNTIADYQTKIAMDNNPKNGYRIQLAKLQRQEGGESGKFGGDIQLQRTIYDLARATGVGSSGINFEPVTTAHSETNASQFFERQSMSITANAKEESLVNFLYRLGNDPAMIRVRELSLHTVDANRYELSCRITFIADYKKAAAKPVPAKAETPLVPTAKLPSIPAPKTNAPAGPKPGPAGVQPRSGPPTVNPARSGGPPAFPTMPGGRRAPVPPTTTIDRTQ